MSESITSGYFSPRIEKLILKRIKPEENILWVGKPDPVKAMQKTWLWVLCIVVSIIGCFVSVYVWKHHTAIEQWEMFNNAPSWFSRMFLFAFCWNLVMCWLWPLVLYWLATRTAYVITDKRVILQLDYFYMVVAIVMEMNRMTKLKRVQCRDGSERINLHGPFSHPFMPFQTCKERPLSPAIRLIHLTDGQAVEALIRQHMHSEK